MRTTPTSGTVRRLAAQGHLVGDRWVVDDDAGVHAHRYAATGEVQAEVGLAGEAVVGAAVAAAREARPGWSARSPGERAALLLRLADLLDDHRQEAAELAALDNGSPVGVLHPGRYTAAWLRYYAGLAEVLADEPLPVRRGRAVLRRLPWGVVAVVPPWNGSMMGMGQKGAPALLAGNTVVAKPPELAPFGVLRFAELALEAGLPPGVVNVVVGGPSTGAALAGHPGIDKISFTGGGVAGRAVMAEAARNLTPVALELGGKSPSVVFPDADLDAAGVMAAVAGTALLSGQGCAFPTRTYVHERVYDTVVERTLATLATLGVGDPIDPDTFVGPVVTDAAMDRILGVVGRARSEGATLLAGGTRLGGDLARGWFVAPTVFGDVDHGSDLARNEVFGPVQAFCRFSDEDEVLAWADDSEFGLAAYLHTTDRARIDRFVGGLAAGMVVVNASGGVSPETPFGGVRRSGFGREGGRPGLEEMVQLQTVLFDR